MGETAADQQVAWVFDLNKCMGCPTCSLACHDLWTEEDTEDQWWCTIETKPSKGHPKGWEEMGGGYDDAGNLVLGDQPTDDQMHDHIARDWDPEKAMKGNRPMVHAEKSPEWTFNWEEDEGAGDHPNSWHFYLPRICMQCSAPSCVNACSEDAIIKRGEDGIVMIDEESCEGNRDCQQACPYKVIWYNEDEEQSGICQMCMGCVPRLEEDVAPACARACPARAVHFGYLGNEESSVHKLVYEWEVALPLHPEYNTRPNVYYIPPLSSPKLDQNGRMTDEPRIPQEYLESKFGEGVHDTLTTLREERQRVKDGGDSELIETLIGWEWPEDFFGEFTEHPDEVIQNAK